jgi:DNA repair protein RecN (Recombination protein N)
MLQKLHIKNFVLIEDQEIDFGVGLNILTGETGAGKSIIIDAISAILGAKVTTDKIRTGCDRAVIDSIFDISKLSIVKDMLHDSGLEADEEFVSIKRELYANGKGRCFINSTQVPVAKLKEIGDYLLTIHGQNEHVTMAKTSAHRELLDAYAENEYLLRKVESLYHELASLKEKILSSEMDEKERNRRIEYLSYAINEITEANLTPNEEEELKEESQILSNAENLFEKMNSASALLKADRGALVQLEKIEQFMTQAAEIDPDISDELERFRTALYSLEDTGAFLRGYEESIDFSPERLNEIEERLSLISMLKKKYGNSIDEILSFLENAENELDSIQNIDAEREMLQDSYRKLVELTRDAALELSSERKEAAVHLEREVMAELEDLNMKGTLFKIFISQDIDDNGEIESGGKTYALYVHGLDKIEFMLAANQGESMSPLRKAASGGEMSRIMLAIKKVLLDRDIVDSLIFDEVDSGISGKTAEQVGLKLKSLSAERQVFVITHLPSIAAMSDNHFIVKKTIENDRTITQVISLGEKDKRHEIARMMAGENVTDTTLKQAEELINNY